MSEARPAILPTRPAPRPASTRRRSSAADTTALTPHNLFARTVSSGSSSSSGAMILTPLLLPDVSGCSGTVSDGERWLVGEPAGGPLLRVARARSGCRRGRQASRGAEPPDGLLKWSRAFPPARSPSVLPTHIARGVNRWADAGLHLRAQHGSVRPGRERGSGVKAMNLRPR